MAASTRRGTRQNDKLKDAHAQIDDRAACHDGGTSRGTGAVRPTGRAVSMTNPASSERLKDALKRIRQTDALLSEQLQALAESRR